MIVIASPLTEPSLSNVTELLTNNPGEREREREQMKSMPYTEQYTL